MLIFLCGYIRDIEKHLHFTIHWDLQFSSSFLQDIQVSAMHSCVGAFSSEKLDKSRIQSSFLASSISALDVHSSPSRTKVPYENIMVSADGCFIPMELYYPKFADQT